MGLETESETLWMETDSMVETESLRLYGWRLTLCMVETESETLWMETDSMDGD